MSSAHMPVPRPLVFLGASAFPPGRLSSRREGEVACAWCQGKGRLPELFQKGHCLDRKSSYSIWTLRGVWCLGWSWEGPRGLLCVLREHAGICKHRGAQEARGRWIWVSQRGQWSSASLLVQAQGGESQQEVQRLQAQLSELQAQLSQKEQAAEHYKLQVRSPAPAPALAPPTSQTPPPTRPSTHPDGEGQDSL